MIGRVFRGADPYGLLKYLFDEGRRNEHADPRLIGSWDGLPGGHEPPVGADGKARVGNLAATLKAPLAGCTGRLPEKFVYHLMLRNHDTDRTLTDAEWADVAARAMARLGIAAQDEAGGCRWVAVRHDDNHIHVAATLAREDGGIPNLWRDFVKLRAFCRESEQRLGLTGTAPADATATPRAGVREQVTSERGGRAEPVRDALRRTVGAAAAGSATPAEFRAFLAARGVQVRYRRADDDAGRIVGASYGRDGHRTAAGRQIFFAGARLAPDLSWPKLVARWRRQADGEPTDEWVAAARRAGTRPDQAFAADRDAAWEQAIRTADQAARRIRATARRSEPDLAADSAWAAADLLASLAFSVEGGAGGPLSAAAAELSRAGRDSHRRVPLRTVGGAGLRAAARVVSALAAGRPDAQLQALLLALAALARAVEDLRAAQHRAHQAGAARVSAERLLAAPPTRRDRTRPGPAHPPGPVPAEPHHRRRTTVHVGEAPDVPPADDFGHVDGYDYGYGDSGAGFEL